MKEREFERAIEKLLESTPNQEKRKRNHKKLVKARKHECIKQAHRCRNFYSINRQINRSVDDVYAEEKSRLRQLENEYIQALDVLIEYIPSQKDGYVYKTYNAFPSRKQLSKDKAEVETKRVVNNPSIGKACILLESKYELREIVNSYTISYLQDNELVHQYKATFLGKLPFDVVGKKIKFSKLEKIIQASRDKEFIRVDYKGDTKWVLEKPKTSHKDWIHFLDDKARLGGFTRGITLLNKTNLTEKEKFIVKKMMATQKSGLINSTTAYRNSGKVKRLLEKAVKENDFESAELDLLSNKKDVFEKVEYLY